MCNKTKQNNCNKIIFQSDASYVKKGKASIAVVDITNNKTYSKIDRHSKTSMEAEYNALKYSVEIAINNRYQNVNFYYDCQTLEIKELKNIAKNNIKNYNFIWTKRKNISQADRAARKVLSSNKEIIFKNLTKKDTEIINDSILIANPNESTILRCFLFKINPIYVPIEKLTNIKDILLLRYTYLSLERKIASHFYKYIKFFIDIPSTFGKVTLKEKTKIYKKNIQEKIQNKKDIEIKLKK
ncbi:MAG: reverse transcriptase-like protein [Campylobacterota bacterium]|nr:reverse transcriptase-like protein [Campylobacterota bacterium]